MNKIVFHNDVAIFDSALNDVDCDLLVTLYEHTNTNIARSNEPARSDLSKHFEFKNTKELSTLKLCLSQNLQVYVQKFSGLRKYGLLNEWCKLQKTNLYEGFHNWHHEHSIDFFKRILVWMVYLNTLEVDDGTTEFMYQDLQISPKKGKLVIWPAHFTHIHRGNPPRKNIKYIATGWWTHVPSHHPFSDIPHIQDWMISKDDYK